MICQRGVEMIKIVENRFKNVSKHVIKLLAKKGLQIIEIVLVENTIRVWVVSRNESRVQDSPNMVSK